ncbi:hypothetical protein ACFX1Z_004055 [Malus domestica]
MLRGQVVLALPAPNVPLLPYLNTITPSIFYGESPISLSANVDDLLMTAAATAGSETTWLPPASSLSNL